MPKAGADVDQAGVHAGQELAADRPAARAAVLTPPGRLAPGNIALPGPLAQLVEQGTLNPKVEGSSPSRPTTEAPRSGVFHWVLLDAPTWRLRRFGGAHRCRRIDDGGAAGRRRDPHPGPAAARVRELHAGRARRRACRGRPCHLGPTAHAGAVRARCPAAPTSRAVPGLPRAVRHLHRPVLAAVRLGRAGDGHLGARGRAPTLPLDPPPAVRQETGARPRARAEGHDRGAPDGGDRLVPQFRYAAGARTTGAGRPGPAPERAVRGRNPRADRSASTASNGDQRAAALTAGDIDDVDRARAGHRRGLETPREAGCPAGHPHRSRRHRQDAAGDRRGRATGRSLPAGDGIRGARLHRCSPSWCCRASPPRWA